MAHPGCRWEAAWEALDISAVTAHYSDQFAAEAYGGREAWLADLSAQMTGADHVRIAVSALDIEFASSNDATASFFRSFRSNLMDETRRMILDLEQTPSL